MKAFYQFDSYVKANDKKKLENKLSVFSSSRARLIEICVEQMWEIQSI